MAADTATQSMSGTCGNDITSDPSSRIFTPLDNGSTASVDDVTFDLDTKVHWTVEYRLRGKLGAGGQGVVYLADRLGADGVTVPVALKMFSPRRYREFESYRREMARLSRIAAEVVVIQQDHLVDVHNFVDWSGRRVMVMEWVDGYDLDYLLSPATAAGTRSLVSDADWSYLSQVVFSIGPSRVRLKPGIANAIVRECLAALGALHRRGIVHADIKPSNIMLKRTGNAKLIDLGAAFAIGDTDCKMVTPRYAAPEVLEGEPYTPRSDLASLGYVLIELLAGQPLFVGMRKISKLIRAKQQVLERLPEFLPADVLASDALWELIRGLVAPNPNDRFANADVADGLDHGAAGFSRQLAEGKLSSEYETDLRDWLKAVN